MHLRYASTLRPEMYFCVNGRSSSVHVMAFRMFDARSLLEPMFSFYIGPFETTNKVLIKMCPVLSRLQCDNYEVLPHKEVGGFMSPEITEIRVLHEMYSTKIDSILCQVFNWCVVGNVGSAVRFFARLRKYPIHRIHQKVYISKRFSIQKINNQFGKYLDLNCM